MLIDLLYAPLGWTMLAIVFVVVFVLIQLFFALRHSFWPGLLTPLLFAGIWIYFAQDMTFLPIGEFITVTAPVKAVFVSIGKIGLLLSLLLYALVRISKSIKRKVRAQHRLQRLEEKERRLAEREAYFRQYQQEHGTLPPETAQNDQAPAGAAPAEAVQDTLQLDRQALRSKGEPSLTKPSFTIDRQAVLESTLPPDSQTAPGAPSPVEAALPIPPRETMPQAAAPQEMDAPAEAPAQKRLQIRPHTGANGKPQQSRKPQQRRKADGYAAPKTRRTDPAAQAQPDLSALFHPLPPQGQQDPNREDNQDLS